jgi:hypothetical protein
MIITDELQGLSFNNIITQVCSVGIQGKYENK